MTTQRPTLDQINVVTARFAESLDFYRLLGVDLPEARVFKKVGILHHVSAAVESGAYFDLDSETFAQVWNSGWKGCAELGGRVLVTFRFQSRDGVDACYGALMRGGHRTLHPPSDAFWGVRFAAVEDPNGLAVGLMSPAEPSMRTRPPDF